MLSIPLSVLDLSPIVEGSDAGQSLRNSAALAQHIERLGYKRFWMAEHHSMPGIASAATAVALAFVGSKTSTIRMGAGGIMLPNHSPLIIAEQFGTLESLFPGRVDLGLGRAPGTDQAAAYAMRRNLASDANQFPNDVLELIGYFRGENGRVRAIPGEGLDIPIWILGSSQFGAQLAAMLGLPYAFASHFAPQMMMEAIAVYRQQFKPSEQLAEPYVMLGFNAIVANTDEQAELLATSVQQAFISLRTGMPTKLPPPRRGYADELPLESRAMLRSVLSASAIGSQETARRQMEEFVERTKPDELIVTAQIYDHEARLRSYELLMEAVSQPEIAPAS
ncbi:LLM class flavin-dependent oxidoreductase [Sphingomonas hankyongi]|uniref:LLM class flavin-dependent oxidoreductase n=1 Tax=Sphingomonas hankyongi TaxID=2908209 RepID=A0ABT0S2F8_9SPHN|nr:LLM class flavin-dependent oxidoreductase [Sphingomonas hankyongi]MCL6729801.1 LLM class flavin-dependent oxidoreductase [Sphingomonas hankyongi]